MDSTTICASEKADVVLVVYDVHRKTTYDQIPIYLQNIKDHSIDTARMILVGSKSDLKAVVSREDAQTFAKKENMQFIEVSAQNGGNINELFQLCINLYNEKLPPEFLKEESISRTSKLFEHKKYSVFIRTFQHHRSLKAVVSFGHDHILIEKENKSLLDRIIETNTEIQNSPGNDSDVL
jgi:50S ribosomal subunit-associated GTPase HflX